MKLKGTLETETFISEGGYYVIKQQDLMDQRQVIRLTPVQMHHIIKDMQNWFEDESWYSDLEDEA